MERFSLCALTAANLLEPLKGLSSDKYVLEKAQPPDLENVPEQFFNGVYISWFARLVH